MFCYYHTVILFVLTASTLMADHTQIRIFVLLLLIQSLFYHCDIVVSISHLFPILVIISLFCYYRIIISISHLFLSLFCSYYSNYYSIHIILSCQSHSYLWYTKNDNSRCCWIEECLRVGCMIGMCDWGDILTFKWFKSEEKFR